MGLLIVSGDPLRDPSPVLLVGINAAARSESSPFFARLNDAFPAALAGLRKAAAAGRLQPGMVWLWRDSRPQLGLLIVRETPFGASRPRYVEAAARDFSRLYRMEGIASAAIGPLGSAAEWDEHQRILERWLGPLPIAITVYRPG